MLEKRPASKSGGRWIRVWRALKPSPRVACIGSLVFGGWSVIYAAQIAASATVVSTFAVPMAIGALLGGMVSGLAKLASVRTKAEVDWVEWIRVSVFFLGAYSPLLRYVRGHPVASTWYAFVGGALVMHSLVVMLHLLKGPSSLAVEPVESDIADAGTA